MSITPTVPVPRTPIALWKLEVAGLRFYDRQVGLIYGGYDAQGNRIDERKFTITQDSTPSVFDLLAACPAGGNFKQQLESFGTTLDPALGGAVS